MADEQPVNTLQTPGTANSEFQAQRFMINQLLARYAHVILVEIKACTNNGGVSAVGFVDALPLVNQQDGAGNGVSHEVIYGMPYFRMQGGANAIIMDPQVGDIGFAVVADRDISIVKKTKAQSNPGSLRKFNIADGIYVGGILNGAPTQYVQFSAAGIKIHSPTLINLDAPDIQLNAQTIEMVATSSIHATTPTFTITGDLVVSGHIGVGAGANVTGDIAATGEVTAFGTHTVSQHTHTQPNDSHGDTEAATNTPTG